MMTDVTFCQRRRCFEIIAPGKFACDLHWLAIPLPLREELVEALLVDGEHSERVGAAVTALVTWLRTEPA